MFTCVLACCCRTTMAPQRPSCPTTPWVWRVGWCALPRTSAWGDATSTPQRRGPSTSGDCSSLPLRYRNTAAQSTILYTPPGITQLRITRCLSSFFYNAIKNNNSASWKSAWDDDRSSYVYDGIWLYLFCLHFYPKKQYKQLTTISLQIYQHTIFNPNRV